MTLCHGLDCSSPTPEDKPFCPSCWHQVPQRMKTQWYHRDRGSDPRPLLDRMAKAADETVHGGRML